MSQVVDFSILQGKQLKAIQLFGTEALVFLTTDGLRYRMAHEQDCCEHVYLVDIAGDLADLMEGPILLAEMVTNQNDPPEHSHDDSYTWTFYKLVTNRGAVTLRWFGTSNGYYSEEVQIVEFAPDETRILNP